MAAHRVLLAGGGSGGSATPVLAVGERLRELAPSVELLFVGTRTGPEAALAAAAGVPYVAVASGKLRRYLDPRNLVDPFRVLAGLAQSLAIVRRFGPTVAFGAGGFASVPPLAAAGVARVPVAIHQQDVEPGLANRLLVPFARRISVSLPGSLAHFPRGRAWLAGNPVRRAVLRGKAEVAQRRFGLEAGLPLVLVTGGGTGALGLNRLTVEAAPRLVERANVVHLTGRGRAATREVRSPRYRALEFVTDEMPHLLGAADVVISRAGMGTMAELAALGKAAIVVPMPGSHQLANAAELERAGAAIILDQTRTTPDLFAAAALALLDDPPRRAALGAALRALFPLDAAERIARELLELSHPR